MKRTGTQDIIINTNPGSALANGTARRDRIFGGGSLLKAGTFALLLGSLGASLLTAAEKPPQPQYRFTELTLPGRGLAYGVNDRGLVTGAYSDPATGNWFSFLFERGVLTTGIAAPGATYTFLGPANNRGVEIGNYGDSTHQQAVLYDIRGGTFVTLPQISNMPLNFGNGINDFGHADGVAYASGDAVNGGTGPGVNWFWDGENYSFFTVPGADQGAYNVGINNHDQVTGYYVDSSGTSHGFVKDGPNFTTLDVPEAGPAGTRPSGINNLGTVAGVYEDSNHFPHGFIWFHGNAITVDVTTNGAIATEWFGINDHGDLVGEYFDTSFARHIVIAERLDGDADGDDGE